MKKSEITFIRLMSLALIMVICKGLQARNAFDYLIDGKDLDFKIMVEVNNVNINIGLS